MNSAYFKKFTSRKFIISAISALCGLLSLIFGANAVIETLASALMVIVPAVVYCVIEGRIDAASAAAVGSAVKTAAAELGAPPKATDTIDKLCDMTTLLVTEEDEE